MFKYISEILAQFTKTQRVMALLMVLTTITIITIGPSLIDSITTDRKELELKITKQTDRISLLENHIDTLDFEIRQNQRSCTQQLYSREEEFIKMLDEIRAEAFKSKLSTHKNHSNAMRFNDTINSKPITHIEPGVKVDMRSILNKIDEMKKKINH